MATGSRSVRSRVWPLPKRGVHGVAVLQQLRFASGDPVSHVRRAATARGRKFLRPLRVADTSWSLGGGRKERAPGVTGETSGGVPHSTLSMRTGRGIRCHRTAARASRGRGIGTAGRKSCKVARIRGSRSLRTASGRHDPYAEGTWRHGAGLALPARRRRSKPLAISSTRRRTVWLGQ